MDECSIPYYVAPEVLKGWYSKRSDIWSLGVVLYQLMTGKLPFSGTTQGEVTRAIKKGEYEAPTDCSDELVSFIGKMLVANPDDRCSAAGALDHPWIKNKCQLNCESKMTAEMNTEMVKNLQNY